MDKDLGEELAIAFLRAYEAKDIDTIGAMFASDVVLRDWNYEVVGKSAAIDEFQKNFREADSLKISILGVYSSDMAVVLEVEILVNGTEQLNVVDVITFNAENQISSIVAYKGI